VTRTLGWLTLGVLAVAVALPAPAPARVADAAVAAQCAAETKRLKAFKRGKKAAKRRFFKRHPRAAARKRFVKRQQLRLKRLQKARRRCLLRPPVPVPVPVPAPAPGRPAPAPAPPARDAIVDVVSPAATFDSSEVTTEDGVEYVRTQLELELEPDATAAEMNALLARLDAEVVSSLEGVGLLTIRIPDPGSVAALRGLVARLAGQPGLAHADLATLPVTTELPDNVPASDVSPVRPQLASLASGAWNARSALTTATAPTLAIADYFGAGAPGGEVAATVTAADFATGNPHTHGYTVLGLAAATFEPGATADLVADQATGMWPGPGLPLRVVDLRRRIAGSTLQDRILQLVRGLSGHVIVNTSLADGCAPAGCTVQGIERDARQWITRVRQSGLEGRFLHVSAAGNIYSNRLTDTDATLGSTFNAAAVRPLPGGLRNLSNTLVVENTTSSDPASGPVEPLCLTATSKTRGQISAVGNDIVSLSAPGAPRLLPAGGTSSAAPQVAGAAAMVWALDPVLTPAQVVGRLVATAREIPGTSGDPRCGTVTAAPGLDYYAAVLASDTAVRSPAREAVLDPVDGSGNQGDGDGRFDEKDLAAFRDAFVASSQDGVVDLDYGRYDLNGDGYTGGGTARMDLDATTPVEWTFSRRRDVLGLAVLHDERAVRDIDVLCHEAHGPHYEGDTIMRDDFARQHCVPPVELEVDPPFPASLDSGQSAQLRVRARRTDLADATVSQQPGVLLELAVTGGTVGAVTGTTGEDGMFATTATLVGSAPELRVDIIARAGKGGPELDRVTVRATRGGGTMFVDQLHSQANALADACAGRDGDGCTIETVRDSENSAMFGSFSGSASASSSETGGPEFYAGNFASATADAAQASDITITTGRVDVDANGAASGSSQRTFGGNPSAHAAFSGQAGVAFRVRVTGSAVDYRAQGTLSGPGTFLYIIRSGGGPFVELVQNQAYDRSGTLEPGTYEIAMGAGCAHDTAPASCSISYTSNLRLGS
jgi:hypothetical protein